MKNISLKYAGTFATLLLLTSCATQNAQYGKNVQQQSNVNADAEPLHTFYLIGDAGNAEKDEAKAVLENFKNTLNDAAENSTVLFLGDNIYPYGLPHESHPNRKQAEEKLDLQIDLVKNFKGKTIFIPGNHDWYSNGIEGLKEQEKYIRQNVDDKAFSPKNSCAIDSRKITNEITLITIDSEWFLADWSKNPGINQKCDSKTREDFFEELESELNKNQNKTVVVALHHPLLDNGSHGGKFSFEKQLFPLEGKIPLPILGSLMNLVRATGGITHQDLSNANYRALSRRLQTLLADRENVVVVSGHDHNLQYIEKGNIRQVISGAGSKNEAATAIGDNDFSYGRNGYAKLNLMKDGSADVLFYGIKDSKPTLLFQRQVLKGTEKFNINYPTEFADQKTTSVYDSTLTDKSQFHKWVWGNNYRNIYGIPVTVPTLDLTNFMGGAKATRSGGGHQTNSLRLETQNGEYVMRALKKSGVRFLQAVAFKDQYVVDDFEDGFADRFLLDFYTSSHPYAVLATGHLSDVIALPHTDPKLYYIPKQPELGNYNQSFGDELYYVEAREPITENGVIELLGTDDVLQLLAKDEKYRIDEKMYIRARLFDMLIGDWDRHYDQWKWEEKAVGDLIYLSPTPKDRDQAFPHYDGKLTRLLLNLPALRHMQNYDKEIKNIKWFNRAAHTLDLAFAKNAEEKDWLEEAKYIQEQTTDAEINKAFEKMPEEVQNDDSERIKDILAHRKEQLSKIASAYYKVLQKTVLLTGTDKKEEFNIIRNLDGTTTVKINRLKKSGTEAYSEKTFSPQTTDEIWLYGRGDDDQFIVDGADNSKIKVRLLGGLDQDVYEVNQSKNVMVYDYKDHAQKPNAKTVLTDDYKINVYDYRKPQYSVGSVLVNLGYNPDDGVVVGSGASWVQNGFKMNPFTHKQALKANYFTGSGGYEILYEGIFPQLTGNWFYQLNAGYTSSRFIRNYFGTGNESQNELEIYDEDYYRIRASEFFVAPSLNWQKNAALFSIQPIYEALKIEESEGRRISEEGVVSPEVFNTQHFTGADIRFHYRNFNKKVSPTLGMILKAEFTLRQNLNDSEATLPAVNTGLGFTHYLTKNEKLVLATYAEARWLLSNDYQFYQMNTLGGNDNLRGYHFDRFYGKNSFFHTTDLRYRFNTIQNSFIPVSPEFFIGADYGRVWLPNEKSDQWHHSLGAGISLNALNLVGVNASYFFSPEGGRLVVGLGMNF